MSTSRALFVFLSLFRACNASGKWQVGLRLQLVVLRHVSIGAHAHTQAQAHTCTAVARLAVLHYCHVDFLHSASVSVSFFASLSLACCCCARWACVVCVCSVLGVYFHILVCMHVVSAAMSLCKLPALCRRQLPVPSSCHPFLVLMLVRRHGTAPVCRRCRRRRARLFLVVTWLVVAAAAVAVTAVAHCAASSFACCFSVTFSLLFLISASYIRHTPC